MKMLQLEECCEILDSMRVPITAKDRKKGPYPYYGANGVQDYVADYIFDDDLVLLAEDGGNFGSDKRPIAYKVSGKCWVNNHAHVLKPKAGMNVDYLCYSLMFYKVDGMVNGATRMKLTQAAMRRMLIPSRTIEGQKAIVKLLNRIQMLIKVEKEQLKKYDELIKSRFVELFGNVFQKQQLKEVSTLITKGASPKWQGIDYCNEGVLFVTSENVRKGFLDLSKKKYLPHKINEILPRSVLHRNDILVNIVNASIGRAAIFDSDELANINQAVALVRVDPQKINTIFLLTFLNSEEARRTYDFMKVGGDKSNLSLKNISELMIPVVSITQQNDFATFVQDIDKSKFATQKALTETAKLKNTPLRDNDGEMAGLYRKLPYRASSTSYSPDQLPHNRSFTDNSIYRRGKSIWIRITVHCFLHAV